MPKEWREGLIVKGDKESQVITEAFCEGQEGFRKNRCSRDIVHTLYKVG